MMRYKNLIVFRHLPFVLVAFATNFPIWAANRQPDTMSRSNPELRSPNAIPPCRSLQASVCNSASTPLALQRSHSSSSNSSIMSSHMPASPSSASSGSRQGFATPRWNPDSEHAKDVQKLLHIGGASSPCNVTVPGWIDPEKNGHRILTVAEPSPSNQQSSRQSFNCDVFGFDSDQVPNSPIQGGLVVTTTRIIPFGSHQSEPIGDPIEEQNMPSKPNNLAQACCRLILDTQEVVYCLYDAAGAVRGPLNNARRRVEETLGGIAGHIVNFDRTTGASRKLKGVSQRLRYTVLRPIAPDSADDGFLSEPWDEIDPSQESLGVDPKSEQTQTQEAQPDDQGWTEVSPPHPQELVDRVTALLIKETLD